MTATCLIPNCRKFAPDSEPLCREHRGRATGGYVSGKQSREPETVEGFRPIASPITPSYTYDVNVTREGDLIAVAEGFRGDSFATRVYDTREKSVRDALVALGWTPPEDKRQVFLAGYDRGFYSAGNYFPEQSWERYRANR